MNHAYGEGTGQIGLDDLQCAGTETSFDDCPPQNAIWGVTNCGHSQDVSIACWHDGKSRPNKINVITTTPRLWNRLPTNVDYGSVTVSDC